MLRVGTGFCNMPDSLRAGQTVAEMAVRQGKISRPGLVLAFCPSQVDAEPFMHGIQAVVGAPTPIIGGSAIGIITNDQIAYEGHPAGVAILESDQFRWDIAAVGGLADDEFRAGKSLATHLAPLSEAHMLLMFYDSIKYPATAATPPVMNASPPLIQGIEEGLPGTIPILGAGLLGDYAFQPTVQFCGSRVARHHVVGAMLSGAVMPYFRIAHGCVPMDGVYHTITRKAGPIIYELDHHPIVNVIDALYGNREWSLHVPVRRLSLGVNMGERYGAFQEEHYVNRLITGVLPDREGIILFEPDLEEGMDIQFMLRDSDEILTSARNNASAILAQLAQDGRRPLFGLYIDCAGRAASVSETVTEEAAEVSAVFRQEHVPLFGFYSGVEVAPFLGKSRGLDWTGVLMVLAE